MTRTGATAEIITEFLNERYSSRAYLPEAVPEDLMKKMFQMAQRTASWCNTQPWQVIVTSGEETASFAAALSAHAAVHPPRPDLDIPTRYEGVYNDRRHESGYALYNSLGITRDNHEARATQAAKNFDFFGAPHTAVITTDRAQGTYGAIDCGGYVATLMLSARALGIASVAQAAVAMYSDLVRSHFDIADDRQVVCAVSFGFEDADHRANVFRTSRADLDAVLEIRS